ncbi:MAG TPA: S8 family serine peptidase, partial [Thermoanaerobaculia bacterium]|nr:S8 family serine peptidase [Thermoanaerobaculia bacterium]
MLLFLLASIAALSSPPQSTLCQTTDVVISPTLTEAELLGCGEGFADNLLWHLDRADSADGTLDGFVTRPATGKNVIIYVCDTGVKQSHAEFQRASGSNVLEGIDATAAAGVTPGGCNGPREVIDPCVVTTGLNALYSHGTAVASIAAGGTTGVAPDARIVPVLTVAREG